MPCPSAWPGAIRRPSALHWLDGRSRCRAGWSALDQFSVFGESPRRRHERMSSGAACRRWIRCGCPAIAGKRDVGAAARYRAIMTRAVLVGSATGPKVGVIDFTAPSAASLTTIPAGLGTGCAVGLNGSSGVIGSYGGAAIRGIDVPSPALPELGPITSTGLGQISAVAVQGVTAAAGQATGGQVALVDLVTATVQATVSTSLAGVGSVAFCTPDARAGSRSERRLCRGD
jgi:hypothetical protein